MQTGLKVTTAAREKLALMIREDADQRSHIRLYVQGFG